MADPVSAAAFVAFLVGAVGAMAAFAAWLIRDTIKDNREQRDAAVEGWQGQTAVTERLADALAERNALDEQMLALLKGR